MNSNGKLLGRICCLIVIGVVCILTAQPVAACAVCYGAPDSAMTKGMNNGIMVLLGVVAFVQICLVALFMSIRQRTRKLNQRKSQFQELQGGTG